MIHLGVVDVYASQDGHLLLKGHSRVCIECPQVLSPLRCPQLVITSSMTIVNELKIYQAIKYSIEDFYVLSTKAGYFGNGMLLRHCGATCGTCCNLIVCSPASTFAAQMQWAAATCMSQLLTLVRECCHLHCSKQNKSHNAVLHDAALQGTM